MMRLYLLIPFQSTLPRGERRKRAGIRTNDINISIHAPTRGATSDCGGIPVGVVISIHAPTRGATTDKGLSTIEEVISIHAPTRGATYQTRRHRNGFTDFNPRSHEGSDKQSAKTSSRQGNFNPRSHEGSDWRALWRTACLIIYFNPRSHEGSDKSPTDLTFISVYFNPRSHEGSDAARRRPIPPVCGFQSTLPRGERHQTSLIWTRKFYISIHAPTRGATGN